MPYSEIQAIKAFGTQYIEYRYEPELPDDELIATSPTCGQCDYYRASNQLSKGNCTLLDQVKRSSSLACPQLSVTPPF